MEENENVAYCFASAYRWAKMYYNFKQKAMKENLANFQKNTVYKIYFSNLVSCLNGMKKSTLNQVMNGVDQVLKENIDTEMVEVCRDIKVAYSKMLEEEKVL